MFRMQPAHPEPPGGPRLAGGQRVGRPRPGAARGVHPTPEVKPTAIIFH